MACSFRILLRAPRGPFSPWGEGARRVEDAPSARWADEGAFPLRKKVAPHQFGQMTYGRAIKVEAAAERSGRARKSWPNVLSPDGRGEARHRAALTKSS